MIKMILAHDKNKTIGKDGRMPWHIPEELNFFKERTIGDSILMGGKTFKGLKGKLTGRKNIVFERNFNKDADESINSIEDLNSLLESYSTGEETLWIAGGKFIYENYFCWADEILVSVIDGNYEGDTKIDIDLSSYNKQLFKKDKMFVVYKYTKK